MQRVALRIAGIELDVATHDDAARRAIDERYAPWRIERAGDEAWTIDLSTDRGASSRPARELPTMRVEGETRIFERIDFRLDIDLDHRRAKCLFFPAIEALHSVTRMFCALALVREGGALVHAASLASPNGAGADLFVGRSGAGKSTLSRLGVDRVLLSDEASAVRFVDGRPTSYATPFWGEHRPDRERPFSAPLRRIFFLAKSDVDRRAPMSMDEAVRRFLGCVFFQGDAPMAARLLESTERILRAVPTETLHFHPSFAVWNAIDG